MVDPRWYYYRHLEIAEAIFAHILKVSFNLMGICQFNAIFSRIFCPFGAGQGVAMDSRLQSMTTNHPNETAHQ